MRALVCETPGKLTMRDVPAPRHDRECLIRVRRAGICGTDLQILEGYAGFTGIPGHEFVGVVEAAPHPGDAHWIGKRVVGEINVGCGRCSWCAAGIKEHCETRSVIGIRDRSGAFAEYLTLPSANLHEVPASIDDDAAVFVEPVAAACRILEQLAVGADRRVAVLGDGRMGLLVGQVLKAATPDVTVLGRHEEKLAVAAALGLATAPSDASVTPAQRYDLVVDVTGRAAGIRRSLELVRPRGTVVLKSTFHGEASLPSWPIVVDEVTLVGSRCGPFDRALSRLAAGAIDVRPLIAGVMPLEHHEMAFAAARRSLKVLLKP